jgi:prepilin-type N-terminal cleavage/methylation domain-containing protein
MARRPVDKTADGGFTLVEILVVIAIVASLIGLVNNVGGAIDILANDNDQYGKYPPSRSKDLKFGKINVGKEIGMPNETNAGIETVHFLLNCNEVQVGQVTADENQIQNTDDDKFRAARGKAPDADAREYCDAWGRPLVYFHSSDYKEPKGLGEVVDLETKEKIQVRPKKMSARAGGGYMFPNSFQLFSLGPDGKQDEDDAEEPDDILYTAK